MCPIHGNIGLQAYQKFVGYYLKTIVPHHLYGTFIFRQSIIKRDLVFRQSRLLPLFSGLSDIDCKFNKFLYDFSGSQRIGVVPRYRVFQPFGKSPRLDNVVSASGADAVIQKLSQRLQSQIFLTQLTDFLQKFVGKNGNVRACDSHRFEDIHDFS